LASVPRTALLLAGTKLEICKDPIQSAYLRRIIQIAMNGGVPAQLFNFIENFELCSKHFDSCSLPLNLPPNYKIKGMESILEHFQNFVHYYPSTYLSESRLRVILWDNLINILFMESEKKSLPLDIVPELNVGPLLGLDKERRVDLALVFTRFDMPVFFIEYALEESEGTNGHKDFTKMSSMMTIACIRLCEMLQRVGVDPSNAKTFGMLVGGTKVQLLVAHPVIKDSADGKVSEIHVVITVKGHWNMSLLTGKGYSFTCSNIECCGSLPHTVTLSRPAIQFKFDNYANVQMKMKKPKINFDSDDDEDEKEILRPESSAVKSSFGENVGLNVDSIKKIDSFIKCAKEMIKKLNEEADLNGDSNKFKKIQVPNISNVPQSLSSNLGNTPDSDKIKKVNNTELGRTKRSLLKNGSYFTMTRKLNFELQLYTEYFRNSSLFPQMISSKVDYESKTVTYTFEKMTEFMGTGNLGLFIEHGNFFGSQIRDKHPDYVILEAATFALHVLYAIYVLHEELGIVHGDISPKNIMFSKIDDIWKLNDYETAMLLEDSLKTKRTIGTPGCICPEAQETGIFDKSSDIYSLGKVLWSTFVMKLICQVEDFENLSKETCDSVDELMNIVRKMIKTAPSDRPSSKTMMAIFYTFMQDNLLTNFNIYGSQLMIPRIEALLYNFNSGSEQSIPLTKISINE